MVSFAFLAFALSTAALELCLIVVRVEGFFTTVPINRIIEICHASHCCRSFLPTFILYHLRLTYASDSLLLVFRLPSLSFVACVVAFDFLSTKISSSFFSRDSPLVSCKNLQKKFPNFRLKSPKFPSLAAKGFRCFCLETLEKVYRTSASEVRTTSGKTTFLVSEVRGAF